MPNSDMRCWATSLALSVAILAATAAGGAAATAELGAVTEIRAGELPAPITAGGVAVQVGEAASSYAVPPGYATITAWSHSAGTTPGALSFKVYRPTGGLREFTVVNTDTRFVTAGSVQTFPVRIPVQPGDRIGLSSDEVELAYETFLPADRIGFFGADLMPGVPRTTDGEPFAEFKLDVSATLESTSVAAPPGSPPSPAPGGSSSAVPAPVLQRLTIAPRAFAAARTGASASTVRRRGAGAKVSFSVDSAASVRFTVQRALTGRRRGTGRAARCVATTRLNRRAAGCMRHVPIKGSFSRTARAGAGSFWFTGRLGGRRLARGSYRLMATPTANGLFGNSRSRTFRISR